jgi:hypothetical protein
MALQRLFAGQGKRRARRPAWMSAVEANTKRRGCSVITRLMSSVNGVSQ